FVVCLSQGARPGSGVFAHLVREQVMTADAKSKAAANFLRFRFIDVFLLVLVFRVYICAALLLAAAQMCFCWIKRKPRSKPAMFFIASKIVEGGILPAFSEGRTQGKV